jgi:hypothetical protein
VLADRLAAGESAARLRSYLKKPAIETWEYVNRLTHAKDAVRMDAEIGLKAVEQLLGTFTPRGTGSDVHWRLRFVSGRNWCLPTPRQTEQVFHGGSHRDTVTTIRPQRSAVSSSSRTNPSGIRDHAS